MGGAIIPFYFETLDNQTDHVLDFLCLKCEFLTVEALVIHLNILDLHLRSGNSLCLSGIHGVILN